MADFFRFSNFQILSQARSQVYQRRFLRPRRHFSVFFELYIFSFAPLQNFVIFLKFCMSLCWLIAHSCRPATGRLWFDITTHGELFRLQDPFTPASSSPVKAVLVLGVVSVFSSLFKKVLRFRLSPLPARQSWSFQSASLNRMRGEKKKRRKKGCWANLFW